MVWLPGAVDVFVGPGERSVWGEFGVVEFEDRRLRVGFDLVAVGLPLFDAGDAHAALRADHILHKIGRLTHHRPPARFVPAD